MALTLTLAKHAGKMPSAPNIQVFYDVLTDASYPAGGYAFDPEAIFKGLGYDKYPGVGLVIGQRKLGYDVEYVDDALPANRKLKILDPAGVEVVDTTDIATILGGPIRVKLESC